MTKTDDGIRCIDVWESQEAFEEFWEARVRPVPPEIGVVDPPEIQLFEVHNYLPGVGGGADQETLERERLCQVSGGRHHNIDWCILSVSSNPDGHHCNRARLSKM